MRERQKGKLWRSARKKEKKNRTKERGEEIDKGERGKKENDKRGGKQERKVVNLLFELGTTWGRKLINQHRSYLV